MYEETIDWTRIRPLKGSQDAAFEELTRQIVRDHTAGSGLAWIAKGAIDAGVEAY